MLVSEVISMLQKVQEEIGDVECITPIVQPLLRCVPVARVLPMSMFKTENGSYYIGKQNEEDTPINVVVFY